MSSKPMSAETPFCSHGVYYTHTHVRQAHVGIDPFLQHQTDGGVGAEGVLHGCVAPADDGHGDEEERPDEGLTQDPSSLGIKRQA